MATYGIMNNAPTSPPLNQGSDNVHAFEWYLWLRSRLPGEGPPYDPGYGEISAGGFWYVYCTLILNPTDAAGRDDE